MKKVNLAILLLALITAHGSPSSARAQAKTDKPKINIAILIFKVGLWF